MGMYVSLLTENWSNVLINTERAALLAEPAAPFQAYVTILPVGMAKGGGEGSERAAGEEGIAGYHSHRDGG